MDLKLQINSSGPIWPILYEQSFKPEGLNVNESSPNIHAWRQIGEYKKINEIPAVTLFNPVSAEIFELILEELKRLTGLDTFVRVTT